MAGVKNIVREFKEFAIKGNMIDMAVGIIIGTAFNKVVNTLVNKIVLPPLSMITGNTNLNEKSWVLQPATETSDAIAIGYGEFIEAAIDFLIIAFVVFLVIKGMNQLRGKAEDPEEKTTVTPKNIELLDSLNRLMEEQNEILRKAAEK